MADDMGSAPYRVHDRRPGSCAGKRKARRKRGAARLKTRARQRAASAVHAVLADRIPPQVAPPVPVAAERALFRRRAGPAGLPPALGKAHRKAKALAPARCMCPRGVIVRVRVKGGLPAVLRCMGRRGRKDRGDVRTVRIEGLPIVPPPHPDGGWDKAPQAAAPVHGGQSSWALPLPRREEPLVEMPAQRHSAGPPPLPQLAPLARNRAPVPWRDGFVAHVEAWVRGKAERLGRLMAAGVRGAKALPAGAPPRPGGAGTGRLPAPAIARANREISALREENEKLRRQVEALERLRQAATPEGRVSRYARG